MIDKQNTFQMITFMLDAGGEKTGGLERLRIAVVIEILDPAGGRALHFGIIFR